MIVVAHRPPLKRIDFSLKPRPPEPASLLDAEAIATLQRISQRHYEHVWRCVERASQAQGSGE